MNDDLDCAVSTIQNRDFEKGNKMKLRCILASLMAIAITGCGASSYILVGEMRPEIEPEQVRIYLHPPAEYEEVAIIEATNLGHLSFTEQGRTEVVVERLKEQAAELGANGVLLQGISNESTGSIGSATVTADGNSAYGIGTTSNIMTKRGNALAIYVPGGTIPLEPEPEEE